MARQFHAAGLQPAGIHGFRQPMDFDVVRLDEAHTALELLQENHSIPVKPTEDGFLNVGSHAAENVEAGMVFVGYGLTIPEFHYDDLAGLDVKGKIVVYLTGGPSKLPGAIKAHYQSGEERRRALAKAGVIGAIAIPNPKSLELGWDRVAGSRFQPRMELRNPGANPPPLQVSVLFNPARAEMLFAAALTRSRKYCPR
jgi:hypothetical protein